MMRSRVCLLAAGLLSVASAAERRSLDGGSPVVSADGASLAFVRTQADGTSRLFVFGLTNGVETAVDAAVPSAFHPCWASDGSLYYACDTVTNTAYGKWTQKADDGGVVIRRWKDGAVRDVLTSEKRDFLPFVTADGKSLYFSSTRWTVRKGTLSTAAHVGVADLDAEGRATNVRPLMAAATHSCGFMQFVVSPDGRFAVWAEMRDTMDGWRVFGADIKAPDRAVNVLPDDFTAYAPRWCPDSRRICFTGYRDGDDGWQVYVADVFSGAVRKIGPGKDPCWTPDGSRVFFERDGRIRRATVEPFAAEAPVDTPDAPEQVVWRQGEPFEGEKLAFRDDRTVFVRVKAQLTADEAYLRLFRGSYAESDQALQLYRDKDWNFAFATRTAGNRFHWVRWTDRVPCDARVTITGIRTPTATYISIDGSWPVRLSSYLGTLDLVNPRRAEVGSCVSSVEVGTGWPTDVPSVARKAVFK